MAVVYIHMKPNTRDIFYVGIGNDIRRAYRNEGRNDHWTNVYKKYGKVVDIIAQDISLDAAKEMEKHIIASLKDSLCNKTLGGEGFFGGVHSEETRRKISEKKKGKKMPKGSVERRAKKMMKRIYFPDLDIYFESAVAAGKHFGLHASTISNMLNGHLKNRFNLSFV